MSNLSNLSIIYTAIAFLARCEASQGATSAQSILDSAAKPFVEFAQVVVTSPPQVLPAPGFDQGDPGLIAVRDLLWHRLRDLDYRINATNKHQYLQQFSSLAAIHSWLLKRDAYSNLAIASFIDDTLANALIFGLIEARISTDEARTVSDALQPRVTANAIMSAVSTAAPEVEGLMKQLETDEFATIFSIMEDLAERRGEGLSRDYADSLRPATLIFIAANASFANQCTRDLISYVEKGGSLNVLESAFVDDFRKRSPECIGKRDPATRVQVDEANYAGALQLAREWGNKKGIFSE